MVLCEGAYSFLRCAAELRSRLLATIAVFTAFIVITGCGRSLMPQRFAAPAPSTILILVSVSPSSVDLVSGDWQHFSATVTGTPNDSVSWSASLGSISANGTYVAPEVTSDSSATVTATSIAYPSERASATVSIHPAESVMCGPPDYRCALTDSETHLLTTTLALGNGWPGHSGGPSGANMVAVDGSLTPSGMPGSKIVRLTDSENVLRYARTFSGGGHNVISGPNANGKRYVAFLQSGGAACMFEFDEAAVAAAAEGECAACSRRLWCDVGNGAASYGESLDETYVAGSVQFPRSTDAPPYSFYAVHQDAVGTSPKLRRYLVVVKSTGLPPDSSGTQTLAYEIDPTFPEYDPDNANCLNGALAVGGYTYGNDYISVDDQRLVLQTNPQDSSPWAVAIRVDTSPPQCRAVNAQTMQISCGWNTPGCWKDLNYNPDAQARFQRIINNDEVRASSGEHSAHRSG